MQTHLHLHSNAPKDTTRIPPIPKWEVVPTPPATLETTSTLNMPTTTQNVDSNRKASSKETPLQIVKAEFLKQLEATAQIRATSNVIYTVHNHSKEPPPHNSMAEVIGMMRPGTGMRWHHEKQVRCVKLKSYM